MAKAARKPAEAVEVKAAGADKAAVTINAAQKKALDSQPTVSGKIRYLAKEGFSRSQITKLVTNATGGVLRYQHVRNVLITPVAKAKA